MASMFRRKHGRHAGRWVVAWQDGATGKRRQRQFPESATKPLVHKFWLAREREEIRRRVGLEDAETERLRQAREASLETHLQAYGEVLVARGVTERYVDETVADVRRILVEAMGCGTIGQIDAHRLDPVIAALRRSGLADRTVQRRIVAVKGFTRWLWTTGLLCADPLAGVKRGRIRSQKRRRRALSDEEARRLVLAAEAGDDWRALSGRCRAMMYRLALGLGLRANEIRTLKPGAFHDLTGEAPALVLLAANTKSRRAARLPIRRDLALRLARYLIGWPADSTPFPVPREAARMLGKDLAVAKIPVSTGAGVVDFHALRHTFITRLCLAGVNPKVIQALARHSSIKVTLDRYAHLMSADERQGIETPPDLEGPVNIADTG